MVICVGSWWTLHINHLKSFLRWYFQKLWRHGCRDKKPDKIKTEIPSLSKSDWPIRMSHSPYPSLPPNYPIYPPSSLTGRFLIDTCYTIYVCIFTLTLLEGSSKIKIPFILLGNITARNYFMMQRKTLGNISVLSERTLAGSW